VLASGCNAGNREGTALHLRSIQGVGPNLNTADRVFETSPSSFRICLTQQCEDPLRLTKFAVVAVRGDVDIATSPQMRRVLSQLLLSGTVDIVVDLEAVEFIDASGIGVLVETADDAHAGGGRLLLRRPSRRVVRVLDLLQLDDVLPIESVSEALSRFE
jgi:anti-sigma B factor antagonist